VYPSGVQLVIQTLKYCRDIKIQSIHNWMVQFQKLTRNLFITLHGQDIHCQQRQISTFLVRYQQFASHAYCGATGPVSKMASQQEKAFCVLRFEVSRSVITVQREFCARFRTAGSAQIYEYMIGEYSFRYYSARHILNNVGFCLNYIRCSYSLVM
jgi:hypothetical protein